MSESSSGYIIGFEVYTGKGTSSAADVANPMDKECSTSIRLVGEIQITQQGTLRVHGQLLQ